ncbi:uncharacterized protein K452DRAFT_287226 [Aplosporella prunicola CBS 121167]|uniref:Uncharacterized protein n=1 Tax=Aplosporella prunicola CBS 121167 TaxID=1176127 RepID=A0A6A6BCV5_9PEZI|nr:uncharacterized protein K452DRAFT_287226 [Aplosporella prunicola CBS 121167]KAF2142032.1 hypothetical protein K452DRAFT_287226 [Aplosporella prunicola CBS 121167]
MFARFTAVGWCLLRGLHQQAARSSRARSSSPTSPIFVKRLPQHPLPCPALSCPALSCPACRPASLSVAAARKQGPRSSSSNNNLHVQSHALQHAPTLDWQVFGPDPK